MFTTILLVYLSTALAIQIIFFFLERYQKSTYDDIFKEYSDIVNPQALINIASFLPIYNIYFLGVLIYSFFHWVVLVLYFKIKGVKEEDNKKEENNDR